MPVTIPNTFVASTVADPGDVNDNFATLVAGLNMINPGSMASGSAWMKVPACTYASLSCMNTAAGMVGYVTDYNRFFGNNGSTWREIGAPAMMPVQVVVTDYAASFVSNGAYTNLATTTGGVAKLYVFDSSGEAYYLASGATGAEANIAIIPPGGADIEVSVASGARLSVKAVNTLVVAGKQYITAVF
jgi:hypothetical protein